MRELTLALPALPHTIHSNFVGIEYVVAHSAAPSLFIIHKRDRTSPTEGTLVVSFVWCSFLARS